MSDEDSDDTPQLSAHALAALQEFYQEKTQEESKLQDAMERKDLSQFEPSEDWQLSQFWYDENTAEVLAKEALSIAGDHGSIACVSSPTAFKKILELKPDTVTVKCLEYDTRFEIFGDDFIFYDFNEPLKLDKDLKNSFDIVIADPPFLTEDCLTKTAVTVKFLVKDKIILCTGSVMKDLALKLLQVTQCEFAPKHANQLQNDFSCYINYESNRLNPS